MKHTSHRRWAQRLLVAAGVLLLLGVATAIMHLAAVKGPGKLVYVGAGLGGVGFLMLTLAEPLLGLAAVIFHGFSKLPQLVLVGPLTIRNAIILVTGLSFLVHLALRVRKLPRLALLREPSLSWLFLFYVWAMLTMAWHPVPSAGQPRDAVGMVNNLILLVLLLLVPRSKRDIRVLLWAVFLGCVCVACLGWGVFFQSPVWTYPVKRLNGIYGNEIVMAMHAMVGMCIGLGLWPTVRHSISRRIIGMGILITGSMALSAASRGVTVATVALGMLFLLSKGFRAKWILPLAAAALVGAIWVSWEPLAEALQAARHTATHVYQAAELSSGRIYLYKAAVRILLENPVAWVVGIGWGVYKEIWYNYYPAPIIDARGVPRLNVHCSYLQVLVETGLIGLSLYAAWTWSYFRRGLEIVRRQRDSEWHYWALGVLYAIIGLLLHSVVDNNGRGNDRAHIVLVGLLLTMAALAQRGD